jgi:YD repeat-containing protein
MGDKLRVVAHDPAGIEGVSPEITLYVDAEAPHALAITGSDVKGEVVNITEGQAGSWVSASATDGESGVMSSGIEALAIEVDKHQQGSYAGECSPGPCTAKATWTLNGRELGAGVHVLKMTATDNAGNIETKTYQLVVQAAAPIAMGPGSVNPQSGDFALESTDVDLKDTAGDLMITRHYDSRNVNEGAEGSLGPQWTLGLGQLASLEAIEVEGKTEGVMVIGPEGLSFFTAKEGGGFEPPPGDSSLSLTPVNGGKEYVLEDKKNDTSTTFTLPEGAKQWVPTISKTAVATDTLTDSYRSVSVEGKTIVEPTEELAPHGKATCPSERAKLLADMEKEAEACRALFFYYGEEAATQSEASGENESQWGWYPNRLSRVVAVAWSTSAGKMEETPEAEYSYDKQGRLRAEWDPRIKHALKTIYGYDSENHVTAVSPPGKQPWLMTYGTTGEDVSAGRLIKVRRPKASTALWAGLMPEINGTEDPVISGTPGTGERLAVSEGKWLQSPLVYGFQWERCNLSGVECSPIAGATNANYTPGLADVGHTLVAKVTATNAGGSVTAASAASAEVFLSTAGGYANERQSLETASVNTVSCLPATTDCVIADSYGSPQYTTNLSVKKPATWHAWSGPGVKPSESLACPTTGLCLLAAGSHEGGGSLYYATSLGGAWKEAFTPTYGVNAVSCVSASLCVAGQGAGGLRESTKPASTSWGTTTQGTAAMSASTCLSASFCVVADKTGNVHVAPSQSSIESNTWTQTNVDGSTALTGVACLSSTSCLAVDGAGNQLALTVNSSGSVTSTTKTDIDGSNALTGISCPTSTLCAAVDNHGNLLVSANAGSSWSKPMLLSEDLTSVSCASKTLCLTASTTGMVIAFNPSEETKQGAEKTPQPGTTIEYHVPVSGSSAPYGMGEKEVEKWGQKDDPAEAAEIFPEEHPQEWPASEKTGATVYYTDNEAQTVNVIAPNGAIATTEYQEGNVVRALSAGNRERALKEPNPVEVAEKLSTKSKYGSEGGELVEVTGPEHKVKLSSGEEVNARNHVHYFYDEGAPANEKGEPEKFGLVTKTTDGALLSNGEEKDVHTTLNGYSGQEGLGWTLRAPTSTTVEPAGADLISSTKYNKETGDAEETRSPAGNAETVSPPVFSSTFGQEGAGEGQFKEASAVAVTSSSSQDIWVDDRGDGRVEQFSSSGTFVHAYESKLGKFSGSWGIAISPKTEDVFVSDSGHNRIVELKPNGEELRLFGNSGEGALSGPTGISVTATGEVWVADGNKAEEFTEEGKYVTSVGEGHLKEAGDVSIDNGEIYVTSSHSVMMFTLKGGEYLGSFGSQGTGSGQFETPTEIVAEPGTGDLLVADRGNERVEEFNPAGKFLTEFGTPGRNNGQFAGISGLAISNLGVIYTSETGADRVQEFKPPEAGGARVVYSTQWGTHGSGPGEFLYPGEPAIESGDDVLVTDNEADDVQKFTPQGVHLATYGSKGSGEDQMQGPTGLTVNQSTGDIYIAECGNSRVQELGPKGEYIRVIGKEQLSCPGAVALDSSGDAYVTDMTKDDVVEYGPTGNYIATYGEAGSGKVQFDDPTDIKILGSNMYITDTRNYRVEILTLKGVWVGQIGTGYAGDNGGEFIKPEGLAFNSASDMFVLDAGDNRIDEFDTKSHYLGSIATHGVGEGQLNAPQGIAVTAAGDIYVADAGNHRVEKWIPATQAVHDIKTIYYTPGTEAGVEACENRPQWAGLACRTEPAAQPTDSSAEPKGEELPELPVVTSEYNMWYQPVKTTEAIGNATRTKTTTYEAERPTQQTIEATGKSALSSSYKYSETQGALIEQTREGKTTSQQLNTLGQLESYTDAEGNTTTYTRDQYGRPTEVDYDASKLDHMEAKTKLHYEETTGNLSELEDVGGEGTYKGVGVGTFKAAYGPEGEITSETYPNDMTATYGYNSVDEGTSLAYQKNNHCTGGECEWFKDSLTPSIHGETLAQESTLAKDQYRFEQPGRLAEVKETPAGEDCTARIYTSNEEGSRTSLTTRKSATSECTATEGGEVQRHTYDEANRLTDEGVQYEPLGNIAKLPAVDAGGHILETSYNVDNQARSQTQGETTNTYLLDPEGRTRATETTVNLTVTTTIDHYPSPGGSAPSWTYNQTTGIWTRNITSFGGLAATEESGKEAVLQLRDLEGDIIGTASPSEAKGKPLTLERSTEYGVPTTEKPTDKYGWLGTLGITPTLPSGAIVQDGATYVPQLGAPLQTEATPEPAVVNTVAPFTITVTPFTPAASIEARSKTEEGGTPSGNLPEPEGEEGGCTGMTACSASVNPHHHHGVAEYEEGGNGYAGCSIWTSYGTQDGTSGISGEIEIYGHWKCKEAVPMFQMQIQLIAWDPEGKKWWGVDAPYIKDYFDVNGDGGIENSRPFACPVEHAWYDAWMFGRQYDGKYKWRWWSSGREAELRMGCHGGVHGPDEP